MDYVLLAATVLGGVALYLMLPREKASLVKLGILLAVMAFGGLFLYIFRDLAHTLKGVSPVDPYFYIFAGIMIAGSIGVICQPKPVYAALYFVLVTLAGAGLFVMLLAEFMAIVLVIIYAGAILVTYMFVIMLASQSTGGTGGEATAPLYDRESAEPLAAVLISFVLLGAVLQCLYPTTERPNITAVAHSDPRMVMRVNEAMDTPATKPAATLPAGWTDTGILGTTGLSSGSSTTDPAALPAKRLVGGTRIEGTAPEQTQPNDKPMGDTQLLGNSLYGQYAISLELAGILLTIALIGAVVIARKEAPNPTLGSGQVPNE
jgi:NADH-quinone oxidoreductase subunit J